MLHARWYRRCLRFMVLASTAGFLLLTSPGGAAADPIVNPYCVEINPPAPLPPGGYVCTPG